MPELIQAVIYVSYMLLYFLILVALVGAIYFGITKRKR